MLELKAVSKAFGGITVADRIDLTIAPGEALGIIGPNGAGKSSLLNLITGMIRPDHGTILFDGNDITRAAPEERSRAGIGRLFQIPQPFDSLTVFENLLVAAMFGGHLAEGEAVQHCGEVLARTGLDTHANQPAGALRLLDRKRLEMARAMATRPRLLLLDEIAGGLTEAECHSLVATIRAVSASGVSIVWIEHVVHALLAVVERLIALDFGRVVMEGEPGAVMQSEIVQTIYMGVPA